MNLSSPNISYLQQLIIALTMGLWLSFFLVFIAPFDASDLPLKVRLVLLPVYGLIAALSYLTLIPLQNWMYKKTNKWSPSSEAIFLFSYAIICSAGCYLYYQSGIINGTYSPAGFLFGQFTPIFIILLPVLILPRWLLYRRTTNQKSNTIILRGDSKLDVLHLESSDLICISSANNYIEVNYFENGSLKKKLLRTTLTKIHSAVPSLLKVHRSYLINPAHFRNWKDLKTIRLTQMEVPVSKKYKSAVLSLNHSPQIAQHSPQTK